MRIASGPGCFRPDGQIFWSASSPSATFLDDSIPRLLAFAQPRQRLAPNATKSSQDEHFLQSWLWTRARSPSGSSLSLDSTPVGGRSVGTTCQWQLDGDRRRPVLHL